MSEKSHTLLSLPQTLPCTASTHIALFVRPFEGEHSEEEREKKKSLCPSIRPRSLFLRSRHRRRRRRRRGELYSSSGRGGGRGSRLWLRVHKSAFFLSLFLCLLSKKGAPAERGEERIERASQTCAAATSRTAAVLKRDGADEGNPH